MIACKIHLFIQQIFIEHLLCLHMLPETYKISAIMAIGGREETENKQTNVEWKNIHRIENITLNRRDSVRSKQKTTLSL